MGNKCSVCGCLEIEASRFYYHTKYGNNLCRKHYEQLSKYGKTLERTINDPNEIILYDDYAEMVLYNEDCEEIARTLIDLEDVEKCKQHKWHLIRYGYVTCRVDNTKIFLHRYIMNAPNNKKVDHINHNKLDNRKEKLRIVTPLQNNRNKSKLKSNKSGVTGVYWNKSMKKWSATIGINYKMIHLGSYDDFDEAVKARKEAEEKYFGEYRYKSN